MAGRRQMWGFLVVAILLGILLRIAFADTDTPPPVVVQRTPDLVRSDWLGLILQGGSFGLFAFVVFWLVRYAPTWIKDVREDNAARQAQLLAEKAETEKRILADKAASEKQILEDKVSTLQSLKDERHEARTDFTDALNAVLEEHEKDRQAWIQATKDERADCDRKFEKMIQAVKEAHQQTAAAQAQTTSALDRFSESNRNIEQAIRGVADIGKRLADNPHLS